MPIEDEINRLLRDRTGYTGDGRGGVGDLPEGDRSTPARGPSNRDLRVLLKAIAAATAEDPQSLAFRPGDAPQNFSLGGAVPAAGVAGRSAFAEGPVRITGGFVGIEDRSLLEFRVGFGREGNSVDPANDAVQSGVQFFNAAGGSIGQLVLVTRAGLVVADGRVEGYRIVGRGIGAGALFLDPPAGAVYARAWIQFFGSGHRTYCDLLMLRSISRWVLDAMRVPAEGVNTTDPDFEWPEEWIPPVLAERVYTERTDFEWPEPWIPKVQAERIYSEDPAFEWPAEWIPDNPVAGTIYVSEGGDNGNDGRSLRRAVRSIEQARDICEANPALALNIRVYPGTYRTQGHIDFPDNCSGVVSATSARSTKVIPAVGFEERNVFRMGNGGYVQGFSFEGGWRVDNLDNPTEGFAIAFRPGAIIQRAVYAHNIVMYRGGMPELIPPPLNPGQGNPEVGRGGGVAIADGAVVSQYSVFPQIMLWGATPVNPNGIGYLAKNGGFINGINAVALWSHKQYMCMSGGEMILTNCASQFGDYTLWSEGSRLVVDPARTTALVIEDDGAASVLGAQAATIVNQMWTAMVAAGYGGMNETFTRRDALMLVRALAFDLGTGQQESTRLFAQGMFDWNAQLVFRPSYMAGFVFSFEHIRSRINALSISANAKAMCVGLINALLATIASPARRVKPSKITAVGHQWNQIMAGVNGRALFRPSLEVRDSVIERNLGTVIFSGVDDNGKMYFTGGALVNPLTGQLEGPPIDRTILPRARRAATIVGGYS